MLVIIGLIIGGILVGQDLIKAAAIRAQISQIEKYNSAVNAFYGKYGGLPGDLSANLATQFGFVTRAGTAGRGNGDGIVQGYWYGGNACYGWNEGGETLLFWRDLSAAGYVDGSFSTATDAAQPAISATTSPSFNAYFPAAKIGAGNYVYVYSTGYAVPGTGTGSDGFNYFGISFFSVVDTSANLTSIPGVSVMQAYSIDKKIDDGLPVSGIVQAEYSAGYSGIIDAPSANPDTASTCYNSSTLQYSIAQNGGTGVNCALSFKMISP